MQELPNEPSGSEPFADGKTTRALDFRYLGRHPALSARPYFGFVWDYASSLLVRDSAPSLLDIGCANGAFAYYALSRKEDLRFCGIDALEQLVEMARSLVPRATFDVGDVRQRETLPKETYTIVTLLTLHSHFDDIGSWLENSIELCRAGGKVLIYGPFNDQPVDVLVRVRPTTDHGGPWIPGWNLHSRAAFVSYLERRGLHYAFHDYLPPAAEEVDCDPLRSRAAVLDGRPIFTNGAGLVLRFALLEIQL